MDAGIVSHRREHLISNASSLGAPATLLAFTLYTNGVGLNRQSGPYRKETSDAMTGRGD